MRKLDDERSMITMTPRRPTSVWSRSNKERVERLTAVGRMTEAGQRAVEAAQGNGSWDSLNDVDAMILPADLVAALATDETIVLDDRLGLFRALAEAPATPAEMAARAGTAERCVAEWLRGQAAGGYVAYDPAACRFHLTPEQ